MLPGFPPVCQPITPRRPGTDGCHCAMSRGALSKLGKAAYIAGLGATGQPTAPELRFYSVSPYSRAARCTMPGSFRIQRPTRHLV